METQPVFQFAAAAFMGMTFGLSSYVRNAVFIMFISFTTVLIAYERIDGLSAEVELAWKALLTFPAFDFGILSGVVIGFVLSGGRKA